MKKEEDGLYYYDAADQIKKISTNIEGFDTQTERLRQAQKWLKTSKRITTYCEGLVNAYGFDSKWFNKEWMYPKPKRGEGRKKISTLFEKIRVKLGEGALTYSDTVKLLNELGRNPRKVPVLSILNVKELAEKYDTMDTTIQRVINMWVSKTGPYNLFIQTSKLSGSRQRFFEIGYWKKYGSVIEENIFHPNDRNRTNKIYNGGMQRINLFNKENYLVWLRQKLFFKKKKE